MEGGLWGRGHEWEEVREEDELLGWAMRNGYVVGENRVLDDVGRRNVLVLLMNLTWEGITALTMVLMKDAAYW